MDSEAQLRQKLLDLQVRVRQLEKENQYYQRLNADNHSYTVPTVGSQDDSNEKKEIESTISQRKIQLYAILDNIPHLVWLKDLEGRFVAINKAFAKFYGLSIAEIIGKTDFDICLPTVAEKYKTSDLLVIRDKKQQNFESLIQGKNSCFLAEIFNAPVFNDVGEVIGTTGMANDITERKRAEEARFASEQRYHCLINQSSDGIVLINPHTLEILEVNERFLWMLGYQEKDVLGKKMNELKLIPEKTFKQLYRQLLEQEYLHIEALNIGKMDGSLLDLEIQVAVIDCKDSHIGMFNLRDITHEKKIQQALKQNVLLAGEVQRGLLPAAIDEDLVKVEGIFEPYHLVSGDFYDYLWNADHSVLFGFVLDVTGHGLAAALQTSALNVLFHQVATMSIALGEKLAWVNNKVIRYFTDESFAAVICFELDFYKETLTYASGGINYFLACSRELSGIVKTPGFLVGIGRDASFEEKTVPIQHGDTFYFMSDGIFDLMRENEEIHVTKFESMVDELGELAQSEKRWDDASVVCLQINGLRKWPRIFHVSSVEDYRVLRPRISEILRELPLAGDSLLELAVNEAVNNAITYSGVEGKKLSIMIEITVIEDHKVQILVKDNGPGFPGNDHLARLDSIGEDYFDQILMQDSGRGIMLMQVATDYMSYNQCGNEVTLIKNFGV